MSHSLSKLGYEAYFYLNQDEIAAEECENLDKPELECNGKCYLAAKLASIEKETFVVEDDASSESDTKKDTKKDNKSKKRALEFAERFNSTEDENDLIEQIKNFSFNYNENISSITYSPNSPPPRLV